MSILAVRKSFWQQDNTLQLAESMQGSVLQYRKGDCKCAAFTRVIIQNKSTLMRFNNLPGDSESKSGTMFFWSRKQFKYFIFQR